VLDFDRFVDKIGSAKADGADKVFLFHKACHQDHFLSATILADLFQKIESVHAGHINITNHYVI